MLNSNMFTLTIEDNFLSKDYCTFLMNYIEENQNVACEFSSRTVLNITKNIGFSELKDMLNIFARKYNSKIEWFELVKWPKGAKHDYHIDISSSKTIFSSIIYLNDNFLGGETVFEDFTITPKQGRLLFFDGINNYHGVKEVISDIRYVVAAWFERLDS